MKIQIPTVCPSCGYPLEVVNMQLFCRNQACDAQLSERLEHFCKQLSIKGMGAKTLAKLELNDITELYYLDVEQVEASLGSKKIAEKLIAEIDRSRGSDLATILPAFSIPLMGNTAATKLCKVVKNIDEISEEKCKEAGLGEKVTHNLISWLETDFKEMREFLPFTFESLAKPDTDVNKETVCITGKLTSFKTKAEAHSLLEAAGFRTVESVTKSTDYLVDEENKGSSKRKKAEELGITIINDLKQFLNIKND